MPVFYLKVCMNIPEIKSVWKHEKSGAFYVVELLTNMDGTDPARYPPTVVYRGANGSVWSAPLAGWHERMTPTERPGIESMRERKTRHIMEKQGYHKNGYVLKLNDPKADICVVDAGAVAWFRPEQWQWLIHNRDHVTFKWPKPLGHAETVKAERESLMKQWDEYRAMLLKGETGSLPRDWFESVIDSFLEA